MRMHNHEAQGFLDFLVNEELGGKFSRMRTRFVKLLQTQIELVAKEHLDLLELYSKKDEEDKPIFKDVDGYKTYDIEDMEKFQKEYLELVNEYFVIDQTPERKDMIECVTQVVLTTTKSFKGQEALKYDRWCDIVENVE